MYYTEAQFVLRVTVNGSSEQLRKKIYLRAKDEGCFVKLAYTVRANFMKERAMPLGGKGASGKVEKCTVTLHPCTAFWWYGVQLSQWAMGLFPSKGKPNAR